ncbi:unnamed protein product [Litomosoides sigmodontis]|uniref:MSP domain-containing protein n=1 Tax=Litomosoides sigmodontis TaxID=42156 RepID=A0A3P6UYB4_LITSI|nr:unnamed protein product [Litomosoides sigmodontis]
MSRNGAPGAPPQAAPAAPPPPPAPRTTSVPRRVEERVPCSGGFTTHTLECVGTSRLCYKIRLKKKYYELYRVSPPLGFLRPGQKKEITVERRVWSIQVDLQIFMDYKLKANPNSSKPGKTFLLVEYIAAPSGYDPRNTFVEGAEVGRVKIQIRDNRIADTVPHIQGQAITQRGQKFQAPAVIDDERIEREVEELYEKKGASQPMFEFNQKLAHFGEEGEEEEKEKEVTRSSKKPTTPSKPKKEVAAGSVGGDVNATCGSGRVADGNSGTELVETIEGKVEKISKEFQAMKYLIAEEQRKANDRLEKGLSDLPFMKFVLILIVLLLLLHLSFY